MLVKQDSLWLSFVALAFALVSRFDGTPMHLDSGSSIMQSDEVVITCVKAVKEDGSLTA